jgi:DNA-damage-inducible protein J
MRIKGADIMATVNYTIRLDEADKLAAEHVFNQLGLTLAAGLNVYVKAVVRQQGIPFELSLGGQPANKPEDN